MQSRNSDRWGEAALQIEEGYHGLTPGSLRLPSGLSMAGSEKARGISVHQF